MFTYKLDAPQYTNECQLDLLLTNSVHNLPGLFAHSCRKYIRSKAESVLRRRKPHDEAVVDGDDVGPAV